MNDKEIFDTIATTVSETFEIDKNDITKELNFKEDLDADSIDFVELILDFEDLFNLEIADEEAEHINTVSDAIAFIKSNSTD